MWEIINYNIMEESILEIVEIPHEEYSPLKWSKTLAIFFIFFYLKRRETKKKLSQDDLSMWNVHPLWFISFLISHEDHAENIFFFSCLISLQLQISSILKRDINDSMCVYITDLRFLIFFSLFIIFFNHAFFISCSLSLLLRVST